MRVANLFKSNFKHSLLKQLLVVVTLLFSLASHANVLILVHGWRSNADSWVNSGVHSALIGHGWEDAGTTFINPAGVSLFQQTKPTAGNKFYRVNLPAHLGLQPQADFLGRQLNYLSQLHQDEKIIIAAHSAGGLVSRMVLTQQKTPYVKALITIATPHLGTPRATDGLDIGHSKPFFCPGPGLEIFKNIVGGEDYRYLRNSDALLVDLLPARQGNILDWLNYQRHPDIEYHSIIKQVHGSDTDGIVPIYSQNMNHVQNLHGRSTIHPTISNHALNPQDGVLIAGIIKSLSQ